MCDSLLQYTMRNALRPIDIPRSLSTLVLQYTMRNVLKPIDIPRSLTQYSGGVCGVRGGGVCVCVCVEGGAGGGGEGEGAAGGGERGAGAEWEGSARYSLEKFQQMLFDEYSCWE